MSWLEGWTPDWQTAARKSAARVEGELDWRPLCGKAADFIEQTYARASHEKDGLAKNH